MLPKLILFFLTILVIAYILFLFPRFKNTPRPIVFFGDSITAGQGALPGEDFPTLIGKTLNVPVVNAGVSGNQTQDALARIDHDVIAKNPSVVVVELGINDLIFNVNPQATSKNFELILSRIKQANVKIVVLGVKIILFQKTYETKWQSLAQKYGATYVPNILDGVITDQNLKYDDIHPNATGYKKIANNLAPIIAPLLTR